MIRSHRPMPFKLQTEMYGMAPFLELFGFPCEGPSRLSELYTEVLKADFGELAHIAKLLGIK